MSGVNKVIIVGRVGKDPDVKHLEGGNAGSSGGSVVANFSVATSESYKDKQGNKVENTEWHNVVVWGKLAEIVEKWVKKGGLVYVEGKLKTRSWEKEGVKQYKTEVVADSMTMLGGGNKGDNGGEANASTQSTGENKPEGSDDLPF